MNKFTPGPWSIEETSGKQVAANGGYYGAFIVGDTSDGQNTNIADICASFNMDDEQIAANGRLISAAPELLEALQEIVSYSGGADNALEDEYVMQRVNAVIAKATGDAS